MYLISKIHYKSLLFDLEGFKSFELDYLEDTNESLIVVKYEKFSYNVWQIYGHRDFAEKVFAEAVKEIVTFKDVVNLIDISSKCNHEN